MLAHQPCWQKSVAVWFTLGLACWLYSGKTAVGQVPTPALAPTSDPADSPTDAAQAARDRLYEEAAADADALATQLGLLKRVVKLVKPTVVHIEAQRDDDPPNPKRRPIEEAGSGVIIRWNSRFYILTNRHVIKHSNLEHIRIKLADGRQILPTQVWADNGTDIALLSIQAKGLIPARLGDSSVMEMGDQVIAVGSPFGLSHSVSYGIISAKGRRDLQLGDDSVRFQDFLQTDAAINPGNSGGPLLNMRGEVIGINTAIASNSGAHEGIGFSIPINMAMVIAKQLIENGSVVRAYLGVKLDATFTPEDASQAGLSHPEGARVTSVTAKSPAELANLKPGDVILEFDGVKIEDDNHLINLVSLTAVGKNVSLKLIRGRETLKVQVTVGDRSEIEP